jgi:hypothetical protein
MCSSTNNEFIIKNSSTYIEALTTKTFTNDTTYTTKMFQCNNSNDSFLIPINKSKLYEYLINTTPGGVSKPVIAEMFINYIYENLYLQYVEVGEAKVKQFLTLGNFPECIKSIFISNHSPETLAKLICNGSDFDQNNRITLVEGVYDGPIMVDAKINNIVKLAFANKLPNIAEKEVSVMDAIYVSDSVIYEIFEKYNTRTIDFFNEMKDFYESDFMT